MEEINVHVILIIFFLGTTLCEQTIRFSNARKGSSFRQLYNIALQDCRTECMARSLCASINYFRSAKKCELNKMTSVAWSSGQRMEDTTGSVYIETLYFTDNQFDLCSCAHGRKCVVTSEGHRCIVEECDRLPTQTSSDMNTVGARADISVQCLGDTQGLEKFGAGGRPHTNRSTMTCSPEDGTWKMKTPSGGRCLAVVFVMAPGTGQDPYYEWMNSASIGSDVTWNKTYRSNIIDVWQYLSATMHTVRFSIFKNRQEVKHVLFDGSGSNSLDWFAQSRVIESSWNDLSSTTSDIFAIEGIALPDVTRRFVINRSLSPCTGDSGWFAAVYVGACSYETFGSGAYPVLFYSTLEGLSSYHYNAAQADFMYILLEFDTWSESE